MFHHDSSTTGGLGDRPDILLKSSQDAFCYCYSAGEGPKRPPQTLSLDGDHACVQPSCPILRGGES
jgi:hypothetical protein